MNKIDPSGKSFGMSAVALTIAMIGALAIIAVPSFNIVGKCSGLPVLVEDYNGYVKIKGSVSWRNNNPGNIIYGKSAQKHRAIGKSSTNKFAKFPDEESGMQALKDLLKGKYGDSSVNQLIEHYAPEDDGNTWP